MLRRCLEIWTPELNIVDLFSLDLLALTASRTPPASSELSLIPIRLVEESFEIVSGILTELRGCTLAYKLFARIAV